MKQDIKSITGLQKYSIDWDKVIMNWKDSIKYEIDIDNDWYYDIESTFSPVSTSIKEKWSISWYVKWNKKSMMAWWKIFIDENWDWKLQHSKEKFVVTDHNWYYEFNNLERWEYNVILISHKGWTVDKNSYNFYLNPWQYVNNMNFESVKINLNDNFLNTIKWKNN